MADESIAHGPNIIHPEVPSAVGSRNSLNRHERNEYFEAKMMADEEVDKILNHIHARLPPEVASQMDVMGTVKSKLHTYYNQNLQNMLNRYLTTMEDELGKKVRDLVDNEELRGLNRYTPRPVSYLLDRVGGSDKFNSGEIEKSIVNMFGHLQGHVQREMNDLEVGTNSLLRRKTDVGAFVRGENAYAITKCSFRNHPKKPDTVFQMKLSLNVLETELISKIYPYRTRATFLLKEQLTQRIKNALDSEIERINMDLIDEGKPEMNAQEKIFQRIKQLDTYISDEETEGSRRFAFLPKKFMDSLSEIDADIPPEEFDAMAVRENVFKVLERENIRNRGWNTAINSLTHILDWSRMGYQHIENYKSSRNLIVREYEATDVDRLPDERYQINMSYYDPKRLSSMREAYITQLEEFERTIMEVWKVVEEIYLENRERTRDEDWDTFSSKVLGGTPEKKASSWSLFSLAAEEEEEFEGEETPEEGRKWNEVVFIQPEENTSTQENPTLETRFEELRARFPNMRETLAKVFEERNPTLRLLVEGRIDFLEDEFRRFQALINPFHINSGVVLDLDIVTIKRKSTTMMNMANVLNEFIYSISAGFQDSAFAEFSRRRSTVRDDIEGQFDSGVGMAEMEPSSMHEEVYE
ncbi:MAG: cytoplasmic filament protein CfpA [Deltaproteobacteria bacterium]|nr:cytoplasmic filament protein CfpA [Deltaproteobacteria bacterium]